MNIPEAAVEAAGQALRDAFDWGVTDFDKQARAALEAAAPHIRAQALREAATTFGECEPEGSYSSTPEQVMAWLREYAE